MASERHYTQLFKESNCNEEEMTVTVIGRDMKCGQDLYVVGLTAADVNRSLNTWRTCKQLGQAITEDNTEWSSYECHCSGGCKQVMLLRWPKQISESSWTLCDITEQCYGKRTAQ